MPTLLPPAGRPGQFDQLSPTLIPNFDRSVVNSDGGVDHQNPALYLQNNPRVDATGLVTIGGTVTTGDTVSLTITSGILPGGFATVTYTTVAGDTTTTIAEGLADLVNDSATLEDAGIRADLKGSGTPNAFIIHQSGPIGNATTMTGAVSSGGTETITPVSPLTGGSGPVMCVNNFEWHSDGDTMYFLYGQPYVLDNILLTKMVTQGMPII